MASLLMVALVERFGDTLFKKGSSFTHGITSLLFQTNVLEEFTIIFDLLNVKDGLLQTFFFPQHFSRKTLGT